MEKDPFLSELTTIVIAHPTDGQPIVKVMTMRIADIPFLIEEAAAGKVLYTSDVRLSETTEIAITCAPSPNRLRVFKARVLKSEVASLVEHLFEKYEITNA